VRAAIAFAVLAACSHAQPVASPTPTFAADDGRLYPTSFPGVIQVANRSLELARAALVVACEQNLFVKDCHP
jgi:hypothetical protein